ncbi:hypothetical protein [Rickettsiella endosymbiont of Dermanyssus gallinae]|uniref:hypothetical protein n=1 Tax=Rickettsiella endosymbiont of Dermanyssus gallinae TaxID=2856608 RepID=UPI001C5306D7|nr:hypothetical protein [Rickettsiella endosymbiont of Dermanyssus gallinae]
MKSINKILNKFLKNNNYYVLKDLNSSYIGCSESVAEEAGLDSSKNIKGKSDYDMIWKESAESFIQADGDLILNKKIQINSLEMIQGSSGMHKVLVSKTGLRKDNGDLVAIISTNIIIDDIDMDIRKKTGRLSEDEQKFYLGSFWGEKYITKREVQVLKCILHAMRQESIVKAMRSRRARDRRALTGEAGNASRRKVICGRHGHELRRSECVPDAGRIAA